ncbi:hypothetical protein WJX74_004950 [Apatococcus lobatus]|uniref:C962R-like N-terminal AEP domain-containing protein n=1 Tax=Apatococcus lobatus TaxID=904363 RepID=A0AAW1QZU1_9CHLO
MQLAVHQELERLMGTVAYPGSIHLPFTKEAAWKVCAHPYHAMRVPAGQRCVLALLTLGGGRSIAVTVGLGMTCAPAEIQTLPQSLFKGSVFDGYLQKSGGDGTATFFVSDCLAYKGSKTCKYNLNQRLASVMSLLNSSASLEKDAVVTLESCERVGIRDLPEEGTWLLCPELLGFAPGKVQPDTYVALRHDAQDPLVGPFRDDLALGLGHLELVPPAGLGKVGLHHAVVGLPGVVGPDALQVRQLAALPIPQRPGGHLVHVVREQAALEGDERARGHEVPGLQLHALQEHPYVAGLVQDRHTGLVDVRDAAVEDPGVHPVDEAGDGRGLEGASLTLSGLVLAGSLARCRLLLLLRPGAMPSEAEKLLASKACASAKDCNLVSLSGGKYLLQAEEDWSALRAAAARDFVAGARNFLVEYKTPVFKLFFDIDFAHATLGLDYVLQTLLPRILEGVAGAIDKQVVYQDVIIATSPAKPKGELTKTGVHLHWHQLAVDDLTIQSHQVQLAVDSESALAIRASVLHELRQLPDVGLDFDAVVDDSVLKRNGLRLLFSSKCLPCDQCMAVRKQAGKDHPCEAAPRAASMWACDCPGCRAARNACKAGQRGHGGCVKGRVYSRGFYSPLRLIRWQGGKEVMRRPMDTVDPLKALQLCSPRFPMSRDPPTLAPVRPEWFPAQGGSRVKRSSAALSGTCSSPLPQEAQTEVAALIQQAMCQHGFFCKIGGDYHSQSISFFMLWPDGQLIQKCHKTGCDGQVVRCGKWPLPPGLAALMPAPAARRQKQQQQQQE